MKKVTIISAMFFLAIFLSGCTFICKKDLDVEAEILRANGIDPVEFGVYKSDGFFKVIWSRIGTGKLFGDRIVFLYYPGLGLKVIPPCIGKLTEITQMNLSYNNITALPSEIGNLKKMYELNLTGNNLKYLPEEIGQCTTLTTLILSANELDTLPLGLGNLTNLKALEIWNNKLQWLPKTIGRLKKVGHITAHDNLLTALPDSIAGMTNLVDLDLNMNQFKVFPVVCTTLALNGELYKLHLGQNPIDTTTIPKEVMLLSPEDYFGDCLVLDRYKKKEYWMEETRKFNKWSKELFANGGQKGK